jgi:hypothetical protein
VWGVKLENQDERLAGAARVMARFELGSAAINGDYREKAQKAQKPSNFSLASQRDFAIVLGISRLHLMGQRHGQRNGAPVGNGSVTPGLEIVGSPRRGDRPGKNHARTARRAVPTLRD